MPAFTTIVPGRLYQVRDLLTLEQCQHIQALPWLDLATTQSPQQRHWPRREIAWNDPQIQAPNQWISDLLPEINRALGTDFTGTGGNFWVDLPGFTCDMHTDGHLANSMQVYWLAPNLELGTGFYSFKDKNTLLYQFDSVPNTGYIMLNHLNADGSQPLQWHGMFRPVPVDCIRVSSYWQFS